MRQYVIFAMFFVVTQSSNVLMEEKLQSVNNTLKNTFRLGYPSDLVYHFFSKRHPNKSFKVRVFNVSNLKRSDFTAKKDTLFVIHGWKNDNDSAVNYKIRETILEIEDINLFVVDWSVMAGRNYISARNSVVRVGQYVAEFIKQLKLKFGLKLHKVKFVGFSLGAHISGIAGAALGGKVDRIVGLDPAGPLFTVKNKDNRLDESDAQFVQVIHTSGGSLGFGLPMGHVDYFPNGGSSQNGCGWDLMGTCAHSRAYAYYAESLRSYGFVARRCRSYKDYTNGYCNDNDSSIMGRFQSDYRARGTYYLTTNNKSPYAKG